MRSTRRLRLLMTGSVASLSLSILAVACGDDPNSPSDGAVVTFSVANETFRVQVASERHIAAARAAQAGGRASIPNGRIAVGSGVNQGWSWHLEDVEFVEATIELCDGRPSDVEREGVRFGGGRFCPWSARVLAISTTSWLLVPPTPFG